MKGLVFNVASYAFQCVKLPLVLYEVEVEDVSVLLASDNTGNPVSKDHLREGITRSVTLLIHIQMYTFFSIN